MSWNDTLQDTSLEKEHPRNLIPNLCRLFYTLQWCTGTGGGISIKHEGKIYLAPSGVQKELIESEDLFVMDAGTYEIEQTPRNQTLTISQCTPLFLNAFKLRNAGAVLHSHSKFCALATLLTEANEIRLTKLEMLKGIRNETTGQAHRYDEVLVIPIIENTAFEKDLEESMYTCMVKYPEASAVLVRRHGIYVWGPTWQSAKCQAEAYDYLLQMIVETKKLGISNKIMSNLQE